MPRSFVNDDFLLTTAAARTLYHDVAADCPIVDYHCHVDPKEIFEDTHFDNITKLWLSGDHYKWRLMRANGVEERYITGDADDLEKFRAFAKTLPRAIGNPLYHWCHLELCNYFGFTGILNEKSADDVWELTKRRLQEPAMGVRGLIEKSRVIFIGTTDDPVDSLAYHRKLANDPSFHTVVSPTFRPDKALNIHKAGWRDYIRTLSHAAQVDIDSLATLKDALCRRMEHFSYHGCRISDHGLDRMVFEPASDEEVNTILQHALAGRPVSMKDAARVQTSLLLFCAAEYARRGWVMQVHYSCLRNPNSAMFQTLGADTGFDCIDRDGRATALARLMDALYADGALPKTVLYSLDAADNAFLDTLIGSFQSAQTRMPVQHGSAWWFHDSKQGILDHLTSLSQLSVLGNFIGMLTDSRSFLSYARHEYFRRILCDLLGRFVENGEYPDDRETLGNLVKDICCRNAVRYFDLEVTA